MPYNSSTSAYERRAATVIDATPDGDTVAVAIDVKLDQGIDDYVSDLNHHNANGNHFPETSVGSDSRFLKQSPAGVVSWSNGVPAADAALKDMSNVANGAIAPAQIAQDASNRFMTDTERTKLSGIEAGAQVNVAPTKEQVEAVLTGEITSHTHPVQIPPGTVSYFAMSSAPGGWLKANGAAISRTTYAAIFAAIGVTFGAGDGSTTFNLPDLRGEFVRGLDDSRGVDSGRVLGSAQADAFKSHTHTQNVGGPTGTKLGLMSGTGKTDGATTTGATGGTETRPRNIALLACIKY